MKSRARTRTLTTLSAELVEVISASLTFQGIDKEKADVISLGAIDAIRKDLSGITVYFPKGISYDVEHRRAEIYERYKSGENVMEMAIDLKLSMQRVYFLIREEREIRRAAKAIKNQRE